MSYDAASGPLEPAGTPPPGERPAADGPAIWCDRCGQELSHGTHRLCVAAREYEPPRFCPLCRRRMKVQVLPAGWSAACVEHGTVTTG